MSKSGKQSMLTIICVQMILCLMCTCNTKTIECPYQGTCSNKQLWCTDNEDCIVNCEKCNGATIYCPRTPHHCNVTCSSNGQQRSCEGTTINAIRQNSNGTKLTVIASGHNDIFQNGVVLCPLYNGECTIYCEYDYACRNLEIQAQSTSHTNIRLIATGSGAFYNGNIHGSPYGTLTVHCTGYSACKGPNSIASDPLSLQMDVVASGQIVLEETDVYCPNNGADKSIICNIDVRGLQAMRDGNIYAREAFYDMNLTCDPSLHEGCDAITLFCGDGSYYGTTYSSSCPIELKTSTVSNEWKCVTSQYECQSFSYPPTVAPSVHLTTVAPSYYSTATRETTAVATNVTYIDVTVKETNVSTPYGVHVSIVMSYSILVNDTNISLYEIFGNISVELFGNISVDGCVKAKHYDLSIDQIAKIVVMNATVYVCNKETETMLIAYYEHQLQTDLITITHDMNPILIAVSSGIHIQIHTIHSRDSGSFESTLNDDDVMATTAVGIDSNNNNDDAVFGVIVLVFGIVLLICICIVIVFCVVNGRKDIKRNKSMDVAYPNSGRMRIPTVSVVRSSMDYNEKKEHFMDDCKDPITPPGSAPRQMNIELEICEGSAADNACVIDDVKEKVRQWLVAIDDVQLREYYDAFVDNGYDSLDIIKEIDHNKQLQEIGIAVQQHRETLLQEILKLQEDYDNEDELQIDGQTTTGGHE
eukprot:388328_1